LARDSQIEEDMADRLAHRQKVITQWRLLGKIGTISINTMRESKRKRQWKVFELWIEESTRFP
jgi:hypothetical protein